MPDADIANQNKTINTKNQQATNEIFGEEWRRLVKEFDNAVGESMVTPAPLPDADDLLPDVDGEWAACPADGIEGDAPSFI